ncbi:alpha-L-rhamnosidase [Natronoglomus mannanivorans]|uniref:alpha-L-rhamnosidase n=1 Tax=Natronoglomus mannanivorans TaxID=2979990 RepID=A0AAP2Z0G9_9EURY|nr:glycoside hydrolase family 78 protein [Halobacteria archaeon AArc-xg1-1]
MSPPTAEAETSPVDLVDLRVDGESEPLDASSRPRFSWRADATERGAAQTAYRILVARSREALEAGRGDLWDSGRVSSSTATSVAYDGLALSSNADYYWTVRIWDEAGRPSEWADVSPFSTTLEDGREWEGEWIGYRPGVGDSNGYQSRWRSAGGEGGTADGNSGAGEPEWVQVDLGEVRPIDRLDLHPAEPFDGPTTPDGMAVSAQFSHDTEVDHPQGAGGFGFPVRYRVDVATDADFADAETVVDRTDEDQPNPGSETVAFDVGSDTNARYVRVVATAPYEFDPAEPPEGWKQTKTEHVGEERSAWETFALAALAVRDAEGTDLAVDCPVTTTSSVESETWGRDHLVNGRYESATGPGSALLRTDVELSKPVARARAHVCGLGYGELSINGEKIGDAVLDPGWTQYDQRVLYSTYDVSEALTDGENAIGIQLGRGWFARNAIDWTGFGSPRAICQLEITYEDGTTRSVSTDGSWEATAGPILENDIYDGETYDARREVSGWNEPGFDRSTDRKDDHTAAWEPATVVAGPGGDLVPQRTPPIRVTETIEPDSIRDHEDGPIVDFGQNLVGWVELEIEGADSGDEIVLRHAETLLEDGSLSLIDLRSADATDRYVAAGEPTETYHPRFTYHGFRYAQISGYPGDLEAEHVRAKVVHTDVEPIGSFDCSNEELAQVQANARWGLRGNLHSVLTDCPQRDERFGWTGDNHIAARALCYNFDGGRFYGKWMDDHADVRSEHGYIADTIPYGYGSIPEDRTWGITQVTIPWHLYRHYGDVGVLERHYEGMRRYLDYWHSVSEDGLVGEAFGNYGDWLAFENIDGRRGLPVDLFNTAFHYHTTNLFAEIAAVLGNEADAERYRERAETIAETFTDEFFDPGASEYGPGTQSSSAVPLFVGLVPDEHVGAVAAELAEKVREAGGKLQTGFLGTRPLVHTLVDHGYPEVAYEVVSQPEQPGWVYMVRQGATAMWERWDSDSRVGDGMNSFNHSPFTFVSEWFYEALAGLRFDTSIREGEVEIAPTVVDDLEWAAGSLETPHGRLASRWERLEHDGGEPTPASEPELAIEIEVPWNTVATVQVPTLEAVDDPVVAVAVEGDGSVDGTEDDRRETIWSGDASSSDPDTLPDGIDSVHDDGTITVTVESGTYRLEVGDGST